MLPWGCYIHGYFSTRSTNPSIKTKAHPSIFIRCDDNSPGYLVYHEDEDEVVTYGYVDAFPDNFPCKERMIAGEHFATLIS